VRKERDLARVLVAEVEFGVEPLLRDLRLHVRPPAQHRVFVRLSRVFVVYVSGFRVFVRLREFDNIVYLSGFLGHHTGPRAVLKYIRKTK